MKKNLAVFISGQGSNLEIFLQNKDRFHSIFVVSSSAKAFGLQRAKNHNVDSVILEKKINWESLQSTLLEKNIDVIFLAGFMKILPFEFVDQWRGKLFNIHPSMLPKYKGLNAIKKAFNNNDDVGVSIHYVVAEVDAGEIVLQEVAVKKDELQNLSINQVIVQTHIKEHQLVLQWIKRFS